MLILTCLLTCTLIFVAAITITVYVSVKYKKKSLGSLGEYEVANMLSFLPKDKYYTLNNITLNTCHGIVQIDHIVVSIYGIFVIETKNYTGVITGKERDLDWIETVHNKSYRFHNPIRQNYAHTKALQELFNLDSSMIIPIVVFSERAIFKVKTNTSVVYIGQVLGVIQKYQDVKLTQDEASAIISRILQSNISDNPIAAEQHISQIKNKIATNQNKLNQGICPACGKKLVWRNGKYGPFIGCNNYPYCTYTWSIRYRA